MDASSIALGVVLTYPRYGDIDDPIAFVRRKFSTTKHNYTTTKN